MFNVPLVLFLVTASAVPNILRVSSEDPQVNNNAYLNASLPLKTVGFGHPFRDLAPRQTCIDPACNSAR
jgi:hypothetical protein